MSTLHRVLASCTLIASLTAAVPAAARAQVASAPASDSIDSVRKDARMRVGPLYVTPELQLKDLGVDTNVFNEGVNQKSDFTVTVTPKGNIWLPVARRALLSMTAGTDLVWYATYASERSLDPQFSARGEVYLRRITFFGENAFVNTRQRPNYEIDVRSRHLENDAAAGAELQLTPTTSVEAAVIRGVTRYDADAVFNGTSLQRMLNRDTTGLRMVARHRVTPLTTVVLRYEDLADRFPYSPARDANSYRVMPGVVFKPRALVSGFAYVGYRRFMPVSPEQLPEFSGLVSQLGLSYTLLGNTRLSVTYRRDVTYSYEELQPFFVNTGVGLAVRRAIGTRFDAIVSADRVGYTYRDVLPQPEAAIDGHRIDTTWTYAGSIGYRVRQGGRVGFVLSYDDRSSTSTRTRTYSGLRAGTVLSYGF
jgi:hypothetical protein